MMGRAGRPQFDDSGKAVIMVHDVKKNFYKKFLYEPFPGKTVARAIRLLRHRPFSSRVEFAERPLGSFERRNRQRYDFE